MNTQRPRPLDRHTAEQLLTQRCSGLPAGHLPLAALLAAAAVPGRPKEFVSEQASLAAFRAAKLAWLRPSARAGRLSTLRSAVAKVLTVKILAVVTATTAGGMALAASTGTLPHPLGRLAPAVSANPSAAHPTAVRSHQTHEDEASRADDAAQEAGAPTPPSPSLVGTCHAYLVADKADHGKALDNPAFTALIAAAGGDGKVGPFCQTLLAASAPAGDEAKPSDKPDKNHPTSSPTDHLTRPSTGPKR